MICALSTCGREFTPKRRHQKFCHPACRTLARMTERMAVWVPRHLLCELRAWLAAQKSG